MFLLNFCTVVLKKGVTFPPKVTAWYEKPFPIRNTLGVKAFRSFYLIYRNLYICLLVFLTYSRSNKPFSVLHAF